MDVSSSLIAVGASGLQAVVWMPNGSGGWNAPTFVGDSGSRVNSINNAGTIAVGHARGPLGSIVAAYWTNTGGTWSGPTILLDGTCARARPPHASRIARTATAKRKRRTTLIGGGKQHSACHAPGGPARGEFG